MKLISLWRLFDLDYEDLSVIVTSDSHWAIKTHTVYNIKPAFLWRTFSLMHMNNYEALFWRLLSFKTLENVNFGAEYGLNQRLHCNFQIHTHLSSNVSQSRYDKRICICHRYIHGQRVIYLLTWRQTLQYQWQCWPKPIGMTSMFWPWRLWMTCCKMPTCCELLCLWCSWERITLCQSAVYARTSHW